MLRRTAAVLAALVVFATSVAVVAPVAGASDTSCASGQPCVVVTWTGAVHGSKTFYAADLAPLVGQNPVVYRTCDQSCLPGRPQTTDYVPCGVPIRDLIPALAAGLGPDAVSTVSVALPKTVSVLRGSTHDLALNSADTDSDGGPFPFIDTDAQGSKLYPVVFASGSESCESADTIGYVRPLRDPRDTIYDEYSQTIGELDIAVDIAQTVLKPTIEPSRTSIKARDSVTFDATLPGGAPDGTAYVWYVNDTPYNGGARFVHQFQGGNGSTFRVHVVTTVASAGASGQSEDKTITIGKAVDGDKPGRGGGNGGRRAPVVGPNDGGGLHAGERPNPRSNGSVRPSGSAGRDTAAGPTRGANRSIAANPSSRATSSRSASPQNDNGFVAINGILLNPQAADLSPSSVRPRSAQPEAAAAARAGAPETKSIVFGVGLGTSVLVLLVSGAFGESRRPGRGSRRRTHT